MLAVEYPLIKASMRSADIGHLADQIARLEAGKIDGLHFDVMDGRFGPEISMGPSFIRGLRKYTKLQFDVHLWVQSPEESVDAYLDAGADILVVHVEACHDPGSVLEHIRAKGRGAGLAMNPATPASALRPYLSLCSEVNVMTIAPGRPGELDEQGLKNLSDVAALVAGLSNPPLIQADGAVSLKTRDLFVARGARSLVAGYPVFSRPDFADAIAEIKRGA